VDWNSARPGAVGLTTPERIDDFLVRQKRRKADKGSATRRMIAVVARAKADANAGSRCSKATKEQKHDNH
jgi:hypothetical protein